MIRLPRKPLVAALLCLSASPLVAQEPDWTALDAETLEHFQAMVRIDTADPPGREIELTNYITGVLDAEGIEYEVHSLEAERPNIVARLRGNGSKRPLLLMAHQDTVNVDASKWTFPPHSAARDSGWIYGRGTLDDKDNLVASLMTLILLKRQGVALDRDVILLPNPAKRAPPRSVSSSS